MEQTTCDITFSFPENPALDCNALKELLTLLVPVHCITTCGCNFLISNNRWLVLLIDILGF